ncbi:hypothetical protein HDU76_012074 [Blyttiomyces sp. JEL0837]|nr:hypothetical protein HDU76_012074 [Blyttiomyces sp. JEL0837]
MKDNNHSSILPTFFTRPSFSALSTIFTSTTTPTTHHQDSKHYHQKSSSSPSSSFTTYLQPLYRHLFKGRWPRLRLLFILTLSFTLLRFLLNQTPLGNLLHKPHTSWGLSSPSSNDYIETYNDASVSQISSLVRTGNMGAPQIVVSIVVRNWGSNDNNVGDPENVGKYVADTLDSVVLKGGNGKNWRSWGAVSSSSGAGSAKGKKLGPVGDEVNRVYVQVPWSILVGDSGSSSSSAGVNSKSVKDSHRVMNQKELHNFPHLARLRTTFANRVNITYLWTSDIPAAQHIPGVIDREPHPNTVIITLNEGLTYHPHLIHTLLDGIEPGKKQYSTFACQIQFDEPPGKLITRPNHAFDVRRGICKGWPSTLATHPLKLQSPPNHQQQLHALLPTAYPRHLFKTSQHFHISLTLSPNECATIPEVFLAGYVWTRRVPLNELYESWGISGGGGSRHDEHGIGLGYGVRWYNVQRKGKGDADVNNGGNATTTGTDGSGDHRMVKLQERAQRARPFLVSLTWFYDEGAIFSVRAPFGSGDNGKMKGKISLSSGDLDAVMRKERERLDTCLRYFLYLK